MRIRVWLLMLTFMLAGCVSTPTGKIVSDNPLPKHPSHVQNWTIDGKLALRYKGEYLNAHFQWHKQRDHYHLRLFGPIGPRQIIIESQAQGVKLTTSDGKIHQADTPETLLENLFQIYLPISNLFSWIRGLPVDANNARVIRDAKNQIQKIQEHDWTIQYTQYQQSQSLYLPTRLHITNSDLSLKVFIYKWQL